MSLAAAQTPRQREMNRFLLCKTVSQKAKKHTKQFADRVGKEYCQGQSCEHVFRSFLFWFVCILDVDALMVRNNQLMAQNTINGPSQKKAPSSLRARRTTGRVIFFCETRHVSVFFFKTVSTRSSDILASRPFQCGLVAHTKKL